MSEYYEEDEGFHFDPTEKELIEKYLIPKLKGEACGDFIVMKDVYAKEPWLLDHTNDRCFKEDEWYYFVKRTQVSEKKIGYGKNVKRKINGNNNDGIDRGYWKADLSETIIDEDTGKIIGIRKDLSFTTSNKKKRKRGDGASGIFPGSESSWLMNEFLLPDENKFQGLVLCKIHKKTKSKNKDDHHHEASTSTHHPLHESSTLSEQHLIHIDHETVLPSYSEQQPLNESFHHYQEIPLIGTENINDQVMKTSSLSDDESATTNERTREQSALERSENLGPEIDNQVHINAPLACLGKKSSLVTESDQEVGEESFYQEKVGQERDWIQDYLNSLLTSNGPGLPVEKDQDLLLYSTNVPQLS